MPLDWAKPVCTKHDTPLVGDLTGGRAFNGRREVRMPSMSLRLQDAVKWPTTWHYDEAGNCSVIGEPNDFDLVNFDPQDNVQRIRIARGR